jgi:hypothetical protein
VPDDIETYYALASEFIAIGAREVVSNGAMVTE